MTDFDFSTRVCISCLSEKPQISGGHVHYAIWHIFASWCSKCNKMPQDMIDRIEPLVEGEDFDYERCAGSPGCYGKWQPHHGLNIQIESAVYKNGRISMDFE